MQATVDTQDFDSSWDGVWWAVVTVTTVGYGDLHPHTVPGRIVAIAVMLLGVGFLAVLTATVASHFVQVDQQEGSEEMLEASTAAASGRNGRGVVRNECVRTCLRTLISLPLAASSARPATCGFREAPDLRGGADPGTTPGISPVLRPKVALVMRVGEAALDALVGDQVIRNELAQDHREPRHHGRREAQDGAWSPGVFQRDPGSTRTSQASTRASS